VRNPIPAPSVKSCGPYYLFALIFSSSWGVTLQLPPVFKVICPVISVANTFEELYITSTQMSTDSAECKDGPVLNKASVLTSYFIFQNFSCFHFENMACFH